MHVRNEKCIFAADVFTAVPKRKPAEKNGWPEGRQACDGMKTKKKLRQARRTRSPLQHAARTGAARTGASCREAGLGPTQRRLGLTPKVARDWLLERLTRVILAKLTPKLSFRTASSCHSRKIYSQTGF